MKGYPVELRTRAVEAYRRNTTKERSKRLKTEEIAEIFGIGIATLRRWIAQERKTNSLEPRPHGGGRTPCIPPERYNDLRKIVMENSDVTLPELMELYKKNVDDCPLSSSSMSRTLAKLGLTKKKKSGGCRT